MIVRRLRKHPALTAIGCAFLVLTGGCQSSSKQTSEGNRTTAPTTRPAGTTSQQSTSTRGNGTTSGTLNGIAWTVETFAGTAGTQCWRLTTKPPATPSRLVNRDGSRCFLPTTRDESPDEWFEVPFLSFNGDVEAAAFLVPPGSVTDARVTLNGGDDAPAFVDQDEGLVVYTAPPQHTVGLVTLTTRAGVFDCGPGEIFTPDDVRNRTPAALSDERIEWPWACVPR
jgi:hypothetical protein